MIDLNGKRCRGKKALPKWGDNPHPHGLSSQGVICRKNRLYNGMEIFFNPSVPPRVGIAICRLPEPFELTS